MSKAEVVHGDCREVMAGMDEASIDAVVCDPPYGLEFMGKDWDRLDTRQPGDETFHKSGAGPYDRAKVRHSLLASYGSADARQRREAEMADENKRRYIASGVTYGRDTSAMQAWHLTWTTEVYRVLRPGGYLVAFGGSRTFHRLACAIEDAGFEVRDCLSWLYGSGFPKSLDVSKAIDKLAGAEREVVGRGDGGLHHRASVTNLANWDTDHDAVGHAITAPATVEAQFWQGWGTALKPAWEPIVLARKPLRGSVATNVLTYGTGALNIDGTRVGDEVRFNPPTTSPNAYGGFEMCDGEGSTVAGRWPANVVLGDDVLFDGSRFFYSAKASANERQERVKQAGGINTHPTVKPVDLMRWLVRLVTPPGGLVLDPFAGSGTTMVAALKEGCESVGIEREDEYVAIARARIDGVQQGFDW